MKTGTLVAKHRPGRVRAAGHTLPSPNMPSTRPPASRRAWRRRKRVRMKRMEKRSHPQIHQTVLPRPPLKPVQPQPTVKAVTPPPPVKATQLLPQTFRTKPPAWNRN